ncbi:MAG: hypothetical protein JO073_09330 [Actinobacteria bacterium]|nr:hypothetical protein [Actinomycetota bacterium]
MKGVAVTLAVGASTAVAFLGLGWAVQAAGLPAASHSSRVGANVAGLLLRSRLSASTLTIEGKTQSALCLHHWFLRADRRIGRGSLITFAGSGRWLDNGGPIRFEAGAQKPDFLPRLGFYLAGCTSDLGKRIAYAAQLNAITLRQATVGGKPALELRLGRVRDWVTRKKGLVDKVSIWVDPATYEPLAVWAKVGKHSGYARVHLVRATPALVHRLLVPVTRLVR